MDRAIKRKTDGSFICAQLTCTPMSFEKPATTSDGKDWLLVHVHQTADRHPKASSRPLLPIRESAVHERGWALS